MKRLLNFGRRPEREALTVWVLVIAALGLAKVTLGQLPYGASVVGALAVVVFLWAPFWADERAGRERSDVSTYGLHLGQWKRDLLFALLVMAVVFPLFAYGFRAFLWVNDHWLPPEIARQISPYGASARFQWRLPRAFWDLVAGNIAVAVAEEFFYRGYLMRRFLERWPGGWRLLGAPVGQALLFTSVLFAAGHLLSPQPFRLGTFFPGLLFGWMALRQGTLLAPIVVHAASNLLIATLEASAFGR